MKCPTKIPIFIWSRTHLEISYKRSFFFLFNVIQILNAFAAAVATKPFNQNVIELQLTADIPKKMTKNMILFHVIFRTLNNIIPSCIFLLQIWEKCKEKIEKNDKKTYKNWKQPYMNFIWKHSRSDKNQISEFWLIYSFISSSPCAHRIVGELVQLSDVRCLKRPPCT